MTKKEIRKKLSSREYIKMRLGNGFGWFMTNTYHRKVFRKFKYEFDGTYYTEKVANHGKNWWFTDEEGEL